MWRVMEIHKIIWAGRFPNCTTLAAEIEVTPKNIRRDSWVLSWGSQAKVPGPPELRERVAREVAAMQSK